ncbi:MAG: ATP-dependent DNA ligase [Actinomycetota bacterium]
MRLEELARTSLAVAGTRGRNTKTNLLAACLKRLRPDEVPIAVAYLSGALPQGAIGVGWAALRDLPPSTSSPSALELLEVDAALTAIATSAGAGSQKTRRRRLHGLFGRATGTERRFLVALLLGELRQGALEQVMVEAVAVAAEVPARAVRRALMVSGDLGAVAAAAIADRRGGLDRFRLTLLRPVQPMLAQTAADVTDALSRMSPAAIEWKLDGARIQVHRRGDEVRAFTRNLADITQRVPEVVRAVLALAAESLILDGEVIAVRADGRPRPFQETMGRFGSSVEVERVSPTMPLSTFFFDCLHLDGEELIDRSQQDRFGALSGAVPEELRVPRIVVEDPVEAETFLDAALRQGHEGVMVKALDAPYEAGRRGSGWLKVKRARTLDLVVLAAEWGHGRRRGWLSNLHLGARDPATGSFVMLGKTFKGMTDRMLEWQTQRLQELETRREGITVFVRPELVVEVAFDGLQESVRYPAGLALRFARVKGYRPDKRAEEADTMETVGALHAGETSAR